MWEKLDDRKFLILSALEKSNVAIIDLSNALSVSEKTIKNEIQILNHELKDGAYIYLKNGVISLFIYNLDIYNSIKEQSFSSSTDFTNPKIRILYMIKRLLDNKSLLLDDLAYEMNVSKSTVTKDIGVAKEGLAKYQLQISGKPNVGISLLGKEIDKRYFILENAYDYIIGKAKFEDKYNMFLYNLLLSFFINDETYEDIFKFFHISMYRVRAGNSLKVDISNHSILETGDYKSISNQIRTYVKRVEDIDLSAKEINFILIPLLGMRTSISSDYSFTKNQANQINFLTDKIFKRIENQMDIRVDLGDITENFSYHIYYLLNRMSLNYKIKNPLSENIKSEYKVAYKMSEIAADVIYEEEKKVINDSEKSFLASYFQIYLFDKLNASPVNQLKVAIISKDKNKALSIVPLLKERFTNIHIIDYYSDKEEIGSSNSYDLIISDRPLKLKNSLILTKGFDNKKLIQKELDNFYFKKHILRKERVLKSLIFTELREDTLYIGEGIDYETNLVKMLEFLENRGVTDQRFTDAILLRESESSTKFFEQIAFPHVKNEDFILSLGIFPKSDVKVIFVVGVPSDDDTLIINLYDEIVNLSSNDNFLKNIGDVKSYRQLMEVIIRQTDLFR